MNIQISQISQFYKFDVIVNVLAIFKYLMKQTIYSDSPGHALQNDIPIQRV